MSKIYLYINKVELPQQNSLQATRTYADGLNDKLYIYKKHKNLSLYISTVELPQHNSLQVTRPMPIDKRQIINQYK